MITIKDLDLVRYLAIAELRKRYAGSAGGLVWGFLSPILTLVALWLVFGLGLKIRLGGGNFLPLLISSLAVWLAFAEAINSGTRSITANPHLVTKMKFPLAVLPTAAVTAALMIHAVVLCFVLLFLFATNGLPSVRLLALLYYLVAFVAFTVPLTLLLAIANVVVRDTAEIAAAVVSLLFWATPIIWPLSMIPERWQWLIYFNPAAYLTDGYRRTLGGGGGSWIDLEATAMYWTGCALLILLTWYAYHRLSAFLSDFL